MARTGGSAGADALLGSSDAAARGAAPAEGGRSARQGEGACTSGTTEKLPPLKMAVRNLTVVGSPSELGWGGHRGQARKQQRTEANQIKAGSAARTDIQCLTQCNSCWRLALMRYGKPMSVSRDAFHPAER